MRPACAVASTVLEEVAAFIQPGVTTREVDEFAAERMKDHGAKSAFLGYRKYPCQICISVNEEVVHGLARTAAVGVWRYCQPGCRRDVSMGLSATRPGQWRWAVAVCGRSG